MSPQNQILEIRLTGDDIAPENMRIGDLSRLFNTIEDLILSILNRESEVFQKRDIVIGLVNVEKGSLGLQLSPQQPDLILPAWETIGNSIERKTLQHLPEQSIKRIQELVVFTQLHNCHMELRTRERNVSNLLTTVTPDTEILPAPYVTGNTIMYGFLIRVGGVDPKIMLQTHDGKKISCKTTRQIAIKLARKLYTWIALGGKARWNSVDYNMEDFEITEILPFEATPLTQVFEELTAAFSEHYSDITDVVKYVSSLREDEYDEVNENE